MLMLTAIREAQLPLLAAVLLGACGTKVWKALRPHAEGGHSDPSALFPAHLRRPIMALVFAAELGLGLGLIGTARHLPGTGLGTAKLALLATAVRTATALFFLVSAGVLNEMRQRRPDAGCGCFGELSGTPIGLRTIARAGLLCASAVATFGLPPLRMPSSSTVAELWLAVLAFELALLAFLSLSSARSWSGSATPRRARSGAKDAGGSWCTRDTRAGAGSTPSSPSTCRIAGPRSVWRSSTPTP